jgi:hypothetical protein
MCASSVRDRAQVQQVLNPSRPRRRPQLFLGWLNARRPARDSVYCPPGNSRERRRRRGREGFWNDGKDIRDQNQGPIKSEISCFSPTGKFYA